MTGQVSYWNRALRFGFIRVPGVNHDYFCNSQGLSLEIAPHVRIRGLAPGNRVEFDTSPGSHLPHAVNIRLTPETAAT